MIKKGIVKFKKAILFAMSLLTCLSMALSVSFSAKTTVKAETLNQDSYLAAASEVDFLRYGYDVTAGRPLYNYGLKTNAPILKDIGQSELYTRINKVVYPLSDPYSKTAYSAMQMAEVYGSTMSGGIKAKVSAVNLDINAMFDKSQTTEKVFSERYEIYRQLISKYAYEIRVNTDLRRYLEDDFKFELYSVTNKTSATNLLKKYGTHLFTGYQFGGLLEAFNYIGITKEGYSVNSLMSLEASMNASIKQYEAGGTFSFTEQYGSNLAKENGISTYKAKIYGGNAPTALTFDHLFQYNDSITGSGNYNYSTWTNAINEGKGLVIVDTTPNTSAIPLWDLLPSTKEYINQRGFLIEAYAELCGDKYNDYLEKYPANTNSFTGSGNSAVTGTAELYGFTLTKNGVSEYKEFTDAVGGYEVYPNSSVEISYEDNIPAGKKEWQVTSGKDCVTSIDPQSGSFTIAEDADVGKIIEITLFGNETALPNANKQFTVKASGYSGGQGTESAPYMISSAEEFKTFLNDVNNHDKHFKLLSNIDFGGNELTCCGQSEDTPFKGVFDGNDFEVSNFKLTTPNNESLALFAYNKGTIKNLTVKNVTIEQKENLVTYAGGLVGYNIGGTIENCKVDGLKIEVYFKVPKDRTPKVTMHIGGLVGKSTGGTAKNSSVYNCEYLRGHSGCESSTGRKYNAFTFVGGLVGYIGDGATLQNLIVKGLKEIKSYSTGADAGSFAGGAVGIAVGTNTIKSVVADLSNCNTKSINVNKQWNGSKRSDDAFSALIDGINDSNTKKLPEALGLSVTISESNLTMEGCYATIAPTGVNKGCTVKSNISYSALALDNTVWCADDNGYPVIIKQFKKLTLKINTEKAKTEYYYGEKFSIAGVNVGGKYEGESEFSSIPQFTFDASAFVHDMTTFPTTRTIKITVNGVTATYNVTIRKIKVVGLIIEEVDSSKKHYTGEKLNKEDYKVYYLLENGVKYGIETKGSIGYVEYPTDDIVFETESYALGENKVKVKCGDLSADVIVKAEDKVIDSIEIIKEPNKTNYFEGENFSHEGMRVKVHYENADEEEVDNNELEIIGGENISIGENKVILAYGPYKTATLTVTGEASGDKYVIYFKNYDGEVIYNAIYEAESVVLAPAKPHKPATEKYTYEFKGWQDSEGAEIYTEELPLVTKDVTYVAVFDSIINKYTVEFTDENGEVLQSEMVEYGATPEYKGETPEKASSAQYTYTFKGWDKEIVSVTGAVTYVAVYDSIVNKYLVEFKNHNGDVLQSEELEYGVVPIYKGVTPTKEKDAQYSYLFKTWDKAVVSVTGQTTYVAVYESVVNKYLVKFVNYNGEVLQSEEVEYGKTPEYKGAIPIKESDDHYQYEFSGWDKTISIVTGEAVYVATYESQIKKYVITFVNSNGDVLQSEELDYGEMPEYKGETPQKTETEQFIYLFAGWDKTISIVTGECTYTALYTSEVKIYTVEFLVDGVVVYRTQVEYGTSPIFKGETPEKEGYQFIGWDKELTAIKENTQYNAVFEFVGTNEESSSEETTPPASEESSSEEITPPASEESSIQQPESSDGGTTAKKGCGGNVFAESGFGLLALILGCFVFVKKARYNQK